MRVRTRHGTNICQTDIWSKSRYVIMNTIHAIGFFFKLKLFRYKSNFVHESTAIVWVPPLVPSTCYDKGPHYPRNVHSPYCASGGPQRQPRRTGNICSENRLINPSTVATATLICWFWAPISIASLLKGLVLYFKLNDSGISFFNCTGNVLKMYIICIDK